MLKGHAGRIPRWPFFVGSPGWLSLSFKALPMRAGLAHSAARFAATDSSGGILVQAVSKIDDSIGPGFSPGAAVPPAMPVIDPVSVPAQPNLSANDRPLKSAVCSDWYAEGQDRPVEVAGVRISIRFIARKGRRGRIAITAQVGAVFQSIESRSM